MPSREFAVCRLLVSRVIASLVAAVATGALVSPVGAQTAANVAVVINDSSRTSQEIGEYYVQKRRIPALNVIRIRTSSDEEIDLETYAATIEQPISTHLARQGLQDRILYVVLTKDVPLRIRGAGGVGGVLGSVDSELTLLYRRMTGERTTAAARIENPYFLDSRQISDARRFTHREYDIYLVTRLDGFSVGEITALIDRGSSPQPDGRVVLDKQNRLVDGGPETWFEEAARRLAAQGHESRVLLDRSVDGVRDVPAVLGYYSWGSSDPRNRTRDYGMGFVPGSLAATLAGPDARSFREPPKTWAPTADSSPPATWFAGSPHSVLGDLIRAGATGAAGYVADPSLESVVRPDILFPAYLAGFNLVEAFYLALPHLSWQAVVIGDPLCAPFARALLGAAEIDAGADAGTGLPRSFAARRLAVAAKQLGDIPPAAVISAVRGETMIARGEWGAARAALEASTELAPANLTAQLQLGILYDQGGQYAAAVQRYQRVVEGAPSNIIALNNLAYALAVRENRPKEALPLAQRAASLAPSDPIVLDTLGWIQHLVGDSQAAAKTLASAVQRAPAHGNIRLHSAIVNAALGARAVAADQLAQALKLDPALESREEVRALRRDLLRMQQEGR